MKFHLSNSLFVASLAVVCDLQSTVYGKGASLTAIDNEQRRALPSLVDKGNNHLAAPIGVCQGDCDSNAECEGDLVCFHRVDVEEVPGCDGPYDEIPNHDYCVEPIVNGLPVPIYVTHDDELPAGSILGLCQGHCTNDDECEDGLVCHQRSTGDPAGPGCFGLGFRDESYCVSEVEAAPEYDITMSSCTFTADSSGSEIGDIVCDFTASGGVAHTVTSSIVAADCVSTLALTGVVQDDSPNFASALDSGSSTQESSTYEVTISLANSAAPAGSQSIDFCLKTEVMDSDGFVYDWIGQKIKLDVAVDGTFSTNSLSTTTFDGNTAVAEDAGDATFGVNVERCDSNGNAIPTATELSLGENFFLCVEGKQSAVLISSIRELTATKTDVADLNLVAINGDGSGEGTKNPNTFVYGYNTNKVVIATRLPAPFFAAGGSVTLSGTANIGTGGRRRRLGSGRSMQAAEEESADFRMDVTIAGSTVGASSGASAIHGTVAMVFGAVAVAFFV